MNSLLSSVRNSKIIDKISSFIVILVLILSTACPAFSFHDDITLSYYHAMVNDNKLSVQDRLSYADSVLRISKDPIETSSMRRIKGDLYYSDCKWNNALKEYAELLNDGTLLSPKERLSIYRQVALSYLKLGNYKDALNTAFSLIKYEKPDSLEYYTVLGKILLPQIYMRTSGNQQARNIISQLQKEVPAVQTDSATWRFMQSYWNLCLAHYYLTQKQWNKAFEAIEISKKYDDTPGGNPKIAINTALIYSGIGKNDIEESIYERMLKDSLNNENLCIVVNNLAELYYISGEYKKVLDLMDDYESDVNALEMYHLKRELYTTKSLSYEKLGNYKEAFKVGEQARLCAEKMSAGYSQELFDAINAYEKEEMLKARLQLKTERRQKLMVGVILILSLILLSIGFVYIRRYIRQRHKDVQEFESKLKVISKESEEKLAESHKDFHMVTSEMSEMSMRMAHISRTIEEISEAANYTGKDPGTRLKKIKQLLKDIDIQSNIWDVMQMYFEHTEYDFFKNLYARHPNLTKGEVRMCIYILKNMTTKEISVVTSRSPRTIDAIKYNLRKKLGITEPTIIYLRRLAGQDIEANTGVDIS